MQSAGDKGCERTRPDGGWGSLRPGPRGRAGRQREGPARAAVIGMLAGLALATAYAVACGGSPGAPASPGSSASPGAVSPSASLTPRASPTPTPFPQITAGAPPAGAVAVARWYWELIGAHQYDAAFGLITGPHGWRGDETTIGVRSTRYIRPSRTVRSAPGPDATVAFGSWVFIAPSAGSPFGTQSRRWLMFSRLVRMSDGTWRLVEVGTGP